MKKKIPLILMTIMLIAGAGILLYPTISNWIAVCSQDTTIRYYEETVDQMDSELMAEEWEKARAYNEKQKRTGATFFDPFDSDNDNALAEDYLAVLNIDGVMGYVEIPNIGVYMPIYHGTSETVIRKGAGHLPGSSLPIGGTGNHAVLTSHSGLSSAKLFTDLENVEEGDVFYIHILDEIMAYEVNQILAVLPSDIEALKPAEGEDYVTLVTCTPYTINSHRLLVRGTRIELTEEDKVAIQGRDIWWKSLWPWIIAAIVLLVVIIVIILRRRRRRKNGRAKA